MPEGPLGNFEVRGPMADDAIWVTVFLEDTRRKRSRESVSDRALSELEDEALGLSIQKGDGQAFAKRESGPGNMSVSYRTFYLRETGADAEEVVRQSRSLAGVGVDVDVKRINVHCKTLRPAQDVLPSQIPPTFRRSGED